MQIWAKEHNVDPMAGSSYQTYKRFQYITGIFVGASKDLTNAKMRKEMLDARPDTSTVLALITSEPATKMGVPAEGGGSEEMAGVVTMAWC